MTDHNLENFYLNISAFGQTFTIVLQKKTNLIAPNARIYEHTAGGVTESLLDAENVYTGYVSNWEGNSRVALTNFHGIVSSKFLNGFFDFSLIHRKCFKHY